MIIEKRLFDEDGILLGCVVYPEQEATVSRYKGKDAGYIFQYKKVLLNHKERMILSMMDMHYNTTLGIEFYNSDGDSIGIKETFGPNNIGEDVPRYTFAATRLLGVSRETVHRDSITSRDLEYLIQAYHAFDEIELEAI
jgi:hypothetical protein